MKPLINESDIETLKATPVFNFKIKEWKTNLENKYRQDGCNDVLTIKKDKNTFRLELNYYVVFTGRTNAKREIESITVTGSGDGSVESGKAITYGIIILIGSILPKYTDREIHDVLKILKIIGNKQLQSNSKLKRDQVRFEIRNNTSAGVMFTVTPL